jgi:hypothetical protein
MSALTGKRRGVYARVMPWPPRHLEFAVAAVLSTACGRRAAPAPAPSVQREIKTPELARITAGNLFDAYAGGGADAIYRGRRYTLVGTVGSVDSEGERVVLGSKLHPVVATGIEKGAIAGLVVDAEVEIDCTVVAAIAEIPQVDCGPNGVPRPVSPPR